jgi:hypothetical protein
VPYLAERFAVRLACGLHLDLLEAVLTAVIARVSACDSFCAFLRYMRQLNFRSISVVLSKMPVAPDRATVPDYLHA